MAVGLATWLLSRLRKKRTRFKSNIKLLAFGAVYQGSYSNYKTDRNPLLWTQFSSPVHTHAININHLASFDKTYFINLIYLLKKGNQVIDPLTMYKLLKFRRPSIINTGYRIYHTRYLKVRLVSAGLTRLTSLVYRSENSFVNALNRRISVQALNESVPSIAYNIDELKGRILEARNIDNVVDQTSNSDDQVFRRAVYLDRS